MEFPSSKPNSKVTLFGRTSYCLTAEMYNAYIMSNFAYNCTVWRKYMFLKENSKNGW